MSDTGISSEATSFWVLFNLKCDNQIKKKIIDVCSRTKKIILGILTS